MTERSLRWLIAATLVCVACGCAALRPASPRADLSAAPEPDSALQRLHIALFDTFVPVDRVPLPDSLRAMAGVVRDRLWTNLRDSPDFRRSLGALGRLDVLAGQSASLRAMLARVETRRFDALSPDQRDDVIRALGTGERNDSRLMVARLRMLYLSQTYGSGFGAAVAGTGPRPLFHPQIDSFLKGHTPRFPRTWLAYDRARRALAPEHGSLDYVIVGSGPAGSVLAHELSQAGLRVLLIDQGSFVIPGAMDTRVPAQLVESHGARFSASGSVAFRNAEAVGGGTTVNIDLAFPPTHPSIQHQIDGWRRAGRIRSDQFSRDRLERAYGWVRSHIGTRSPAAAEVNANNQVLWDGATRQGAKPRLYDLNTDPPGHWRSPITDKRSSVSGLLLEAMTDRKSPLALLPDAKVLRVRLEPSGDSLIARGVTLVMRRGWDAPGVLRDPLGLAIPPGDTVTVDADRVLVCAGALGSPALLLRSGLRNPNIGRGIVAHIALPVIGEFEQPIDAFEGTDASVYVDSYALTEGFFFEAMAAGPEYAAVMAPGNGRQTLEVVRAYRHLAGFGAMLIDTPRETNRVTIDAAGEPVIHYAIGADDLRRMRRAVGEGIRIMFRAGARRAFIPSNEPLLGPAPAGGFFLNDIAQAAQVEKRLMCIPNRTLLTSAHLQASNKMGASPANSVVANDHHVWGAARLYVMDASIFPTSIGANPMQSIYTFAKLFADRLVAEGRMSGAADRPAHR